MFKTIFQAVTNLIKIFVVSYVKKIMFSFFEIKLKSTLEFTKI